MNPIVLLIAGVALLILWFGFDRALNPDSSENQKLEPTVRERRIAQVAAVRALAFFYVLDFVVTAVCVLIGALLFATFAPPPKTTFADAYGQAILSTSGVNGPLNPAELGGAIVNFIGAIVAVIITQRFMRGRRVWDLGLRPYKLAPLDTVAGLLFAPITLAVVFVVERSLGYIVGTKGPTFDWGQLSLYFLTFLLVAFSEEIVVRGFFLQTLNSGWDGTVAVIGSSVFWGLTHILNPSSSPIAALDIMVVGLIFAYAYVITGHLWLPIALHLAWNLAEAAIFGFPVSGFMLKQPVFQPFIEGPAAVTGGNFGPEGGIVMVFALAVLGGLLFGWSKVRQPPAPKADSSD